MINQFNLLYPDWQGYASHQDVYHGAKHLSRHTNLVLDHEVDVPLNERLINEGGIIGRSSIIRMLEQTNTQLKNENPASIFMVGGTCGSELSPISFLNQKYDGDLAVFWFDAHGDLNTPETSPSHRFHGMPLRSLLGDGDPLIIKNISRKLTDSQVALVGVRDLDPPEENFVKENGLPVLKPQRSSHISELIDFAKSQGLTKAYIHFDLDVLDPVEFPHMLLPVEGGMSVGHAVKSLQLISQHLQVVGCSVVEFCPKNGGALDEINRLIIDGMGVKF